MSEAEAEENKKEKTEMSTNAIRRAEAAVVEAWKKYGPVSRMQGDGCHDLADALDALVRARAEAGEDALPTLADLSGGVTEQRVREIATEIVNMIGAGEKVGRTILEIKDRLSALEARLAVPMEYQRKDEEPQCSMCHGTGRIGAGPEALGWKNCPKCKNTPTTAPHAAGDVDAHGSPVATAASPAGQLGSSATRPSAEERANEVFRRTGLMDAARETRDAMRDEIRSAERAARRGALEEVNQRCQGAQDINVLWSVLSSLLRDQGGGR